MQYKHYNTLDCQDLTCIIQERTTRDVKCRFLPELRKFNFASIDNEYSVINEWEFENALLEFDDRKGRTSQRYPIIELRLKLKRRWKVFFWRVIFFMVCLAGLDLTAYSLNYNGDLGDRLALIVTLILTIVSFSSIVFDQIPNVSYLTFLEKYILVCYVFTTLTMIQTAIAPIDDRLNDTIMFEFSCIFFISYHIIFLLFGLYYRYSELEKLQMTSYQIRTSVQYKKNLFDIQYSENIYKTFNQMPLRFETVKKSTEKKARSHNINHDHGQTKDDHQKDKKNSNNNNNNINKNNTEKKKPKKQDQMVQEQIKKHFIHYMDYTEQFGVSISGVLLGIVTMAFLYFVKWFVPSLFGVEYEIEMNSN